MKKSKVIILIALLAIAEQSCKQASIHPFTSDNKTLPLKDFYGVTWRLAAFQSAGTGGITPVSRGFTIRFFADSTAGGGADCNSYGAGYTTNGENGITMRYGVSTKVLCPPGSPDGRYIADINNAYAYHIGQGQLKIICRGKTVLAGEEILIFKEWPEDPSHFRQISGTTWRLDSFQSFGGVFERAKHNHTFRYDALNHTASGSADCNVYTGLVSVGIFNGVTITASPATNAVCAEPAEGERFMQELNATSRWNETDGRLFLRNRDGQRSLIFSKE